MTQQQVLLALQERHQELEAAIEEARGHPAPDTYLMQMLKRQKLRIKDKIHRLNAA